MTEVATKINKRMNLLPKWKHKLLIPAWIRAISNRCLSKAALKHRLDKRTNHGLKIKHTTSHYSIIYSFIHWFILITKLYLLQVNNNIEGKHNFILTRKKIEVGLSITERGSKLSTYVLPCSVSIGNDIIWNHLIQLELFLLISISEEKQKTGYEFGIIFTCSIGSMVRLGCVDWVLGPGPAANGPPP